MAMNEKIAKKTIEDHKYLLEHVDNRAAIAYFAVANRNYCLFQALKSFLDDKKNEEEANPEQINETQRDNAYTNRGPEDKKAEAAKAKKAM